MPVLCCGSASVNPCPSCGMPLSGGLSRRPMCAVVPVRPSLAIAVAIARPPIAAAAPTHEAQEIIVFRQEARPSPLRTHRKQSMLYMAGHHPPRKLNYAHDHCLTRAWPVRANMRQCAAVTRSSRAELPLAPFGTRAWPISCPPRACVCRWLAC